jgi:hypothetical protein
MKGFVSQISGLNTQKFNSGVDGGKYNSLLNNTILSPSPQDSKGHLLSL